MAQSYTTDAGVLYIPGAYPQITVEQATSGVATTGVLMLVGEADAGPDYSLETDITQNGYGPDQLAAVISKYKTGPLVDAFRAASVPSTDPQIQGSAQRIYLVKSNASTKASASLTRSGLSAYSTLADRSYGALGNNLYYSIADSIAEVAVQTGSATLIPTPSGATLGFRVNGGSLQTLAIAALAKPVTTVGAITTSASGLNSLTGLMTTGGRDRGVITGLTGITLAIAATGNNVVLTIGSGTWATTPTVGDTLLIPGQSGDYSASAGSVIKGGSQQNGGAYVVTAVSSTTISATKLRNNAAGVLTAPVTVSAVAISATAANDLLAFSPINIQNVTGTDRSIVSAAMVTATVQATGTISGSNLVITLSAGTWAATPVAGDYLFIPATAPAAIASAAAGWYTVASATTTTVTLTRLSDDRAAIAFSATTLAATTNLQCLRKEVDGQGKTLELQDAAGTDNVSTLFYQLSTTAVTWLSTTATPVIQRSAAERKLTMSVLRNSDSVNETITAGSDIALKVGYQGTTATLTITTTTISTTVTGGTGANWSFTLASFRTIGDLVAKINAQTGYLAAAGTSLMSQLPIAALDEGTFGICSTQAVVVAGIKKDAYHFFNQLQAGSSTVQLGTTTALNVAAGSGLPENVSTTFLSGGAKGATTGARALAAIDACEKIRGNSLITLFSRDATSDITDGLTDSASTYTVDAINAYVVTHCTKMSALKRRRPRQGFCSKKDTFVNAKLAAANLAAARCSLTFQDVKAVGLDGTVTQYQPWYGAALAAGFQAAAFYRPIFNKLVACSGILQAAGDFSDADDSQIEDALIAGLLVLKRRDVGGIAFVSDQTTYTVDSNFVYNSIQAVYVADVLAQTIAQQLEKAFVGQSLADVSAALVLSHLKGIIANLRRLKLVVGDDAAPEGYRDAVVQISGPAIAVSLSLKEATGVYYIPIKALIQQVSQTATT